MCVKKRQSLISRETFTAQACCTSPCTLHTFCEERTPSIVSKLQKPEHSGKDEAGSFLGEPISRMAGSRDG